MNTTNIKHVLPAPLLETSTSVTSRFVEDIACPHSSCHLPPKSCAPAWRIDSLLTSSLRPARAHEQRSVGGRAGNHNAVPRCFVSAQERSRVKCNRLRRSSASFTMLSISSSVWLYAIHTRASPPNSFHRHFLQSFALPRRVIAVNLPENNTRLSESRSNQQD